MINYQPDFIDAKYKSHVRRTYAEIVEESKDEILRGIERAEEVGEEIISMIKRRNPKLKASGSGGLWIYNAGFVIDYQIKTREGSIMTRIFPRTIARVHVDTGNCAWDEKTIHIDKSIKDKEIHDFGKRLELEKRFKFCDFLV